MNEASRLFLTQEPLLLIFALLPTEDRKYSKGKWWIVLEDRTRW